MNCRKRITWNSIHMEQHSRQFNIIHPLYVRSDVSLTSNHTWNRNTNKSNKCHKMIQQWYKKCVIKEVLLSTEHTHNNNNKTDSSDRWEPTANFQNNYAAVATKRRNATTIKEDGAVSPALRSILHSHTGPRGSLWVHFYQNNSIMGLRRKNQTHPVPKTHPMIKWNRVHRCL